MHSTSATPDDVPFLDLLDPTFQLDAESVRCARDASWYARTPLGFAVLGYAEVAALLKDRRLRQGGPDSLAAQGVTSGPLFDWMRQIILNVEGADHSRLRRLVTHAFTPAAVEALRPRMRAVAHELIDRFADRGECDFMDEFADPYPSRIICELLEVPRELHSQFNGWANDLGLAFSQTVAQHRERIEAAVVGLHASVDALVAKRRRNPGQDLISALIASEEAGERLSDQELRVMVSALIFGGQDTTRNQLGRALVTFLEHPDQWTLLGDWPELAPTAVEEVLRASPAVPAIWRVATESFEFNGLAIPAGTFLQLLTDTANADPAVFGLTRLDITQSRPAQLTFGGGIHYCLGAPLARAELAEALPILAARLRQPSLAGEVWWRPALGIYGPLVLPIRFTAERRAAA
ncbi:MAG TPA: cytochrome P450 [Chloroflexota bacterium]